MSDHVSKWLDAYHDGELHGNKLHYVAEHLAQCDLCQAELESYSDLSTLLHEVPAPQFMPVSQFAAQINLRLPHKQPGISRKQILQIGWWMIPVGLLAAWIFVATLPIIGDMLSVANQIGLISSLPKWWISGSSNGIYLSATLGQAGLLSSTGLKWLVNLETFTRTSLPQVTLQLSIALLYLGWIAIGWAHRTHPGHGPLLES